MKSTVRISGRMAVIFVLFLVTALAIQLPAQTQPGKAKVQAVKGQAVYSVASGPAALLTAGIILDSGATIKTAKESSVDLFLGKSAGTVRILENTTLGLDKLALTDTGVDTVIEAQLNLPEGVMLFNVNKLSAASKYEIKVPNGVAGIRGTSGRIGADGTIFLNEGKFVFVFVPPGGNPRPVIMTAPPQVIAAPPNYDVRQATPQETQRYNQESRGLGPGAPFQPPGPPPGVPFRDPFVSPGTGKPQP